LVLKKANTRFPSPTGILDHIAARLKPARICHIPHHAAINAMPPISKDCVTPLMVIVSGKMAGLNKSTSARPEFCMPVSMDIDLRSKEESLNKLAEPNPVKKAAAFWKRTRMKI
jgi:hypothetical protein